MARPIIGIPMQTLDPIPGQTPLCWIMGQMYVRVLTEAGAIPWLIPPLTGDLSTLRGIYEQLDGLFLTGGVDVDPACYNEAKEKICGRTDVARDWAEMQLIAWAVADKNPVLGVCRGAQVLNVACGGTLYQDVGAHFEKAIKHDYFPTLEQYTRDMLAHEVTVAQESRLGNILQTSSLQVNSMHHQGIKELAEPLLANAWAPDGLIEGVESKNGQFLVGVQWHPEELTKRDSAMHQLFEAFIQAGSEFHQDKDHKTSHWSFTTMAG